MHEKCWPQQLAIVIIDEMITWINEGSFTSQEYIRICEALGKNLKSQQTKRCALSVLSDLRRQHVEALDVAELSVTNLIPKLVGSSSIRMIKSVGTAHGLSIKDEEAKEVGTNEILDHVARGNCADGNRSAPGCKRFIEQAAGLYMSNLM